MDHCLVGIIQRRENLCRYRDRKSNIKKPPTFPLAAQKRPKTFSMQKFHGKIKNPLRSPAHIMHRNDIVVPQSPRYLGFLNEKPLTPLGAQHPGIHKLKRNFLAHKPIVRAIHHPHAASADFLLYFIALVNHVPGLEVQVRKFWGIILFRDHDRGPATKADAASTLHGGRYENFDAAI